MDPTRAGILTKRKQLSDVYSVDSTSCPEHWEICCQLSLIWLSVAATTRDMFPTVRLVGRDMR